MMIPAGTTASADFSTASGALANTAVPHHPANQTDGASGTPVEISPGKTSNLHRAPIASTRRPLDGHRASPCRAGSPRPPRLIRAARRRRSDSTPCVPRVATSSPASFPPRLATTQLPLTCGWCHQPPQGTRTPELLVMLGALGRETASSSRSPHSSTDPPPPARSSRATPAPARSFSGASKPQAPHALHQKE